MTWWHADEKDMLRLTAAWWCTWWPSVPPDPGWWLHSSRWMRMGWELWSFAHWAYHTVRESQILQTGFLFLETAFYVDVQCRVIGDVDAVIVSHAKLSHIGALPYLVSKCGLVAPVYSTLPVKKMGEMFLTEIIQAKQVCPICDLHGWHKCCPSSCHLPVWRSWHNSHNSLTSLFVSVQSASDFDLIGQEDIKKTFSEHPWTQLRYSQHYEIPDGIQNARLSRVLDDWHALAWWILKPLTIYPMNRLLMAYDSHFLLLGEIDFVQSNLFTFI